MTASSVKGRPARGRWSVLSAALLVAVVASPAAAGEVVVVNIDQATILKLPDRAATVVVGNPLIADLSVQVGGVAVVTGKGYGLTNIVAMDRTGAVLMERAVQVLQPRENLVVVYRGVERETYSCKTQCEPRLTLGDSQAFFNSTLTQIGTRNAQAMASGSGAAPAAR